MPLATDFQARLALVCLALFVVLGVGCAAVESPAQRQAAADALAVASGWQRVTLASRPLSLVAYGPPAPKPSAPLFVYLEGDGLAWLSRSTPSPDPTPRDPVALKMALRQPGGNAVYLARPCQYGQGQGCAERYWTQARFAPEVVDATDRAIGLLKDRYGARTLVLVGYSGGGALAALVAGRRQDVVALVTVAGNLDTAAWTRLHGVSPLSESLNPADFTVAIARVPQWHFAGSEDRVVPPSLAQGFVARFPPGSGPKFVVEPGFDHHCCWADAWPRLLRSLSGQPGWPAP
jgi:dienelactone hydrolase